MSKEELAGLMLDVAEEFIKDITKGLEIDKETKEDIQIICNIISEFGSRVVDKVSGELSSLVENVLCEFIYLDCNQEINYKNMTGEQVVQEYDKVIKRLLDRYNISLDDYYVRSEDYE